MNSGEEFELCKSYFKDLEETKHLSLNDKKDLHTRINDENHDRDLLVKKNLNLVIKIAKTFQGKGMELIDLIQEGNLALVKAAETFDAGKDYSFSTYATTIITRELIKAVRDEGKTIRIPQYMYDYIANFNSATNYLQNKLNREPVIEEVAEYLKISISNATLIYNAQLEMLSLNSIVDEENDIEQIDLIKGEEYVDSVVLSKMMYLDVEKIFNMGHLTEKEIFVLTKHLGLDDKKPISLDEISRILGCSRETNRRCEIKALKKLRENIDWDSLCDYQTETGKILKKIGRNFYLVDGD